jgi:hypothetical protein
MQWRLFLPASLTSLWLALGQVIEASGLPTVSLSLVQVIFITASGPGAGHRGH